LLGNESISDGVSRLILDSSLEGVRIAESEYSHIELGWQVSTTGTAYPQAREWDDDGNMVRDIDFTDHNRPKLHPNPHYHLWEPNQMVGSRKRSRIALPLF
jgi:hypothetical protein